MEMVFGLRLRQYAVALDGISAAIKRTKDYDENFSPSAYTPCRRESRERLEKLHSTITGYCYAMDDLYGLSHGRTETLFFRAYEKGIHRVKPYEAPDSDSGYATFTESRAESDADEEFTKALTGVEEE